MIRVLPRDAFNDANLLKCIGKLTLLIVDGDIENLFFDYDGQPFDIHQDPSDGSTYVENVKFTGKGNQGINLERPLNSREGWSLIADGNIDVFNEDGIISDEFIEYLKEQF